MKILFLECLGNEFWPCSAICVTEVFRIKTKLLPVKNFERITGLTGLNFNQRLSNL